MPTYDYYTYTARTNPISQYINTNSCTATSSAWTWPAWSTSPSAEITCSTGPDYRIYTNMASQGTDWMSESDRALATALEMYMNRMNGANWNKKELEKDVDENKLIDLLDQ